MLTTSGTYPWSFVIQIFHNCQPRHGGDRQILEVITSTLPKGTLGSIFNKQNIFVYVCMHNYIYAALLFMLLMQV